MHYASYGITCPHSVGHIPNYKLAVFIETPGGRNIILQICPSPVDHRALGSNYKLKKVVYYLS
jgi:hypothetical protein